MVRDLELGSRNSVISGGNVMYNVMKSTSHTNDTPNWNESSPHNDTKLNEHPRNKCKASLEISSSLFLYPNLGINCMMLCTLLVFWKQYVVPKRFSS